MDKPETLPRIPGINVADIVRRLSISWEELRPRLEAFAGEHGRSCLALRAAMDAGDHDAARRLAGGIGTAAASFGADKLWEKCRALEAALRTGERFYEHLYDDVEMEVFGLIKGIQRLGDANAGADVQDVIASLYDFAALRRALSGLQAGLRRSDWTAANAALQTVREEGVPPVVLEGFRELEKLVRDRCAADALKMAGILKQNLDH